MATFEDKPDMRLNLSFFSLQNFKAQAMAVTADPEHKFELAIGLGDVRVAYTLAKEAEVGVVCWNYCFVGALRSFGHFESRSVTAC